MTELAKLTQLTTLWLAEDTQVTDAGLKELTGLKNLTTLYLLSKKVTEAGKREFLKALPKCKFAYPPVIF